ncbi:MAG: glycoside hydrolase family 2 protein [Candidatus Limnocylindria bacterium]
MPPRGAALAVVVCVTAATSACAPRIEPGSLPPTLVMATAEGRGLALQNGIPVPTFEWQPRPRIELDGGWRVDPQPLDADLSLTERARALGLIEAEGEGRHAANHPDESWARIEVPGTHNPPPDGREIGAWYRRAFTVPRSWTGQAVTLKFASVNYLADVWLNGTWLGYHEGGSTPFAFDAAGAILPAEENVIAVRVDNPAWGTRTDIVPWGLGDWWNYGGITGSVWLEATPEVHLSRADVVPHLDAADVTIAVHHAALVAGAAEDDGTDEDDAEMPEALTLRASLLPAEVSEDNLLDPDPRRLVPSGERPLAIAEAEVETPAPNEQAIAQIGFQLAGADPWTPILPALFVLRVEILEVEDELWTTFGLRHVAVDTESPRVLLNGRPFFFRGVGLHDEAIMRSADGSLLSGTPASSPEAVRATLAEARSVGANLLRQGHMPADPVLLMLADRLGFAVWEEIPLYHFTPLTFTAAMDRGIPQQMLREMALRDMNRPSVLFHGLANESTGQDERLAALTELHEIDREIDGTRLTGQAAYGWQPADPTHAPLDLAGFTLYHGVFYGDEPRADTESGLRIAHETHPDKPIMALEFGRWADTPAQEPLQLEIFEGTYAALERHRSDQGGFLSAATWWALNDFATQVPGIEVEHFGLYGPDGELRPAGEAAVDSFHAPGGAGDILMIESDARAVRTTPRAAIADWQLAGFVAYALVFSIGMMAAATFLLSRRGGRSVPRRRA